MILSLEVDFCGTPTHHPIWVILECILEIIIEIYV